ncbi:MAG TPA: hypothetical protein PKG60_11890 [Spirochaetota bacterium]|nr:hypothetical protein [Spirochaetota bacterium]HPS87167.1 hypothetical protein [Spirochaetota bacterium]
MQKKTDVKYKSKMNELKENRAKYFPLIEMLLYVERKTSRKDLPIEMTDLSQIAIVMELIDLGYINKDAFIIKKQRRDITGVFYKGGYPLTNTGIKVYRQHLHERRGKFIRGLMLIALAALGMFVFYMIVR